MVSKSTPAKKKEEKKKVEKKGWTSMGDSPTRAMLGIRRYSGSK